MAIAMFWILFALAAILPVRWVVYLFFAGLAFGSFNTIPGGFNLTPYGATAPLLAVKLLGERGAGKRLGDAVLNPLRFGVLSAFVLYALTVTATAPTLFHGVIVVGLNTNIETPLHYGMGNLTQAIYLITAWLVTLSVFALIRRPGGLTILAQALLLGGGMVVTAGLADMLTVGSGVLAPLRTASYAILATAEIGPFHRVIGFNTEASSYGALALFFATSLLFLRPSRFAGPLCRKIEPVMTLALFVFCFLSTSSAAFLGLAATLLLSGGSLVAQGITASHSVDGHRATIKLMALVLCLWAVGVVVMFCPTLATPLQSVVDQALFQKAGTDSYIERMSWSRVSMAAFMHSGGYGVGLGSTRASSFPVAVASSTGVLGSALLVFYFARCLLAPLGRVEVQADGEQAGTQGVDEAAQGWRQAIVGARLAWVVCLVPAASVATTVDLSFDALFFAIMATAGIASPAVSGAMRGNGGSQRNSGARPPAVWNGGPAKRRAASRRTQNEPTGAGRAADMPAALHPAGVPQ